VNDKSVTDTLIALQTQRAVADFVATHQGMEPAHIQQAFIRFIKILKAAPPPAPGMMAPHRNIKAGGRNE
jgi:hypothetical protein